MRTCTQLGLASLRDGAGVKVSLIAHRVVEYRATVYRLSSTPLRRYARWRGKAWFGILEETDSTTLKDGHGTWRRHFCGDGLGMAHHRRQV